MYRGGSSAQDQPALGKTALSQRWYWERLFPEQLYYSLVPLKSHWVSVLCCESSSDLPYRVAESFPDYPVYECINGPGLSARIPRTCCQQGCWDTFAVMCFSFQKPPVNVVKWGSAHSNSLDSANNCFYFIKIGFLHFASVGASVIPRINFIQCPAFLRNLGLLEHVFPLPKVQVLMSGQMTLIWTFFSKRS